MINNKIIKVTYKSGKGKLITRIITNLELDYGLYNGKEQWMVKALCCYTNKNIVIELTETKFG